MQNYVDQVIAEIIQQKSLRVMIDWNEIVFILEKQTSHHVETIKTSKASE